MAPRLVIRLDRHQSAGRDVGGPVNRGNGKCRSLHSAVARGRKRALAVSRIDAEIVAAAALLAAVLVVGLATASDYGLTVDEFNVDDYGPKALAWYTSGFRDRSHFETVEFSLWYYGPWLQMLTAYVQSFDLADRVTVRHAMTFLVGLAGVAALLPIGRLAAGRWAGLSAIALCLMTGYFYGNLFFTPIDVPFMAAMSWATLAILVMTRPVLPSWPATIAAGLLAGLAIATRTGGIIIHAYLLGALLLCAVEFGHARPPHPALPRATRRALCRRRRARLDDRDCALAVAADRQSARAIQGRACAFCGHSDVVSVPALGRTDMDRRVAAILHPGSAAGPAAGSFPPVAGGCALSRHCRRGRHCARNAAAWRLDRGAGLRAAALALARARAILTVCAAIVLPLGFLIIAHATIYDGIRHVLFVVPMLAVLAGAGARALLPLLPGLP